MSNIFGVVYLVGAGPGDPGLITMKGYQLLCEADVVIYDRLANTELLQHVRPEAETICVGKSPGRHSWTQQEINSLLVEKAKSHSIVVRLKGGDPTIFARGGEEAEECRAAGIRCEFVPGITSALAVPAYAGIPVTHREMTSSLSIITGHEHPDKQESSLRWEHLALGADTLVFLMGMRNLEYIVEQLLKYREAATPVALIRQGTYPSQESIVGNLSNIVQLARESGFSAPAIIVVGAVVKLRERLAWFENNSLFGKRILVTRARAQSSGLVDQIHKLGGEAVQFPVIKIAPPKDLYAALDKALKKIDSFDWIIFSSCNGVEHFMKRLQVLEIDIRSLHRARLAAIGPQTAAALERFGLRLAVIPDEYRAEALAESLQGLVGREDKILIPRADIARRALIDALQGFGCHNVTVVDAYSTQLDRDPGTIAHVKQMLQDKQIDVITFTSSSTVCNFAELLDDNMVQLVANSEAQVCCIGPVTASTAAEFGINVDRVAEHYTIEGLLEVIQLREQVPV